MIDFSNIAQSSEGAIISNTVNNKKSKGRMQCKTYKLHMTVDLIFLS